MTIWESFDIILSDLGGLFILILSLLVSPAMVIFVLGGTILFLLVNGLFYTTSAYAKKLRKLGWIMLLGVAVLTIVFAAVVQYVGVNGIQPYSWEWTK